GLLFTPEAEQPIYATHSGKVAGVFATARPVLVLRLATPTALDRGLLERNGKKLDMERKVIKAGNFTQGSSSEPQLLERLVREARGNHQEGLKATSFAQANRWMARSEEERQAFESADVALGITDKTRNVEEQLERAQRLKKDACEGRTQLVSTRAVVESLQAKKRRRSIA
ncbi:unnamed protein product, partial [Effrenium voratum]